MEESRNWGFKELEELRNWGIGGIRGNEKNWSTINSGDMEELGKHYKIVEESSNWGYVELEELEEIRKWQKLKHHKIVEELRN